ncbi:conserved oligomeric Golgi complex subunit 1 isoform X2 [Zerene cesonia]|uniref:conserved oligomeric Golgi complex subunit 1 isoform X2 n=1 Tax=Zerene cesonia TaxID=33412 RepID=UPI0018E554DA|nr:conserved oligomeric Golgi complex subunit 1 isoform X2 [Zerene cesonia]XP_038222007.1 conserved oligomeric Golgi complex subunit 1 isoform X2 [Zerene cesonia]
MAYNNLLEVEPEQLFQTHSIVEIDQVQKKLQYEIERKREELRAMVGERYRDLIHAADTIEEMRSTTASTLNHISNMMSICKNLHNAHLIGFKVEEKPSQSNSPQIDPVHGISVQIKLLTEIPEKIWKCINGNDFIKAAQLFIMARHVNTGLQLQIGSRNDKQSMQPLQRIVQQQWNSISNLSQTIIDMCGQRLQDFDISVEVACSCLVGLYLLDSRSMVELLNTLINLHSNNSLKTTLQFDLQKILEGDVKAQIKNKIVNGVKIVMKTIELIYACFVENKGGVVIQKLEELYRKDSIPLLELVQFSDHSALKLLPSVISQYRLTANKSIQALSNAEISSSVQDWSVWVKGFVSESVKALLQNVSRVRVLHEIREEAFKIESPTNWSTMCESLNVPPVHAWCSYFQPLLTSHVKVIVDNRWLKIYDTFKTQLLIDLTKVSADSEVEKEVNINWFIWKDLIGDTVIESRNDVISVMNSLMKGMSQQDRGFTPNLEKLCKSLDVELQKLLDDLRDYLYVERKKEFLYDEDERLEQMYIDTSEIEVYLCDVTDKYIESMLAYIKACFEEPTLQSTIIQRKTTAIYTARFVQAITILIPNIRKCYIPDNYVNMLDESLAQRWHKLCDTLKDNCQFCWGKWLALVMDKAKDLTNGLPQGFSLEENIDYLMMQWDVIKIVEKDDEGNSIESTIKVPAGPSLKLQEYLYAISRLLDDVIPHTLPVEIHTSFIDNITSITFAHYNNVIREKETDINQRCALQLLMDVRHLTLLLVPRENKKCMEFSQEICEFLRQKIDPFDYDVFYPYIQTNLKRSVQRVQTLLGSLILHHGQLTGIIGTKPVTSGGSGDKAANILASADSQWFSILPVATPANLHKKQDKPKDLFFVL